MSSMSSSLIRKRPKNIPTNSRNYIGKLPDGVLSHILSRVPLRDAVRTCVLSKDWEFKWTLIYNVDINLLQLSRKWRKEKALVNVVERVLHHVHHVENFSLFCICHGEYELSRLASLMSAILRRNIKCLNLEMRGNQHFVLPRSLSHCDSLRELSLKFETPCSFKVPVKSSFPNLKIVSLERVKIINEVSITDTLYFTFPVLKVLKLEECKWVNVKSVEIYAPSLRTFTSRAPHEWDDKKDLDYSIKVYGAKIAEFCTGGGYLENISMVDSTVSFATLECMFYDSRLSHEECGLQVRKLLRGISNVECLFIMDVLPAIGQTKQGLPLLMFRSLEELHLVDAHFDAEGLLELLNAAPYLKCLEIPSDKDEYDYDSVEILPYCVVHSLEEVMINYKSMNPSYHIEKFIFKNGAQLKSVFIDALDEFPENNMVEMLSTFPKASTSLKIFVP